MLYLVLLLVLGSLGLLLTSLRTHDTLWAWASVGISVVAALLLLFDWAGRRLAADKKAATDDQSPAETTAPVPATDATSATSSTETASAPSEPGSTPAEESAAATAAGETATAAADSTGPHHLRAEQRAGASTTDSTASPETDPAGSSGDHPSGRHLATGETARHALPTRPGYRTPSRIAPAAAPGSVPVSLDPAVEPPEEDTDAADALRVAELSDEVRVLDERPRYHLAGCAWVGDRLTLPLPVHEARELGFSPCGLCRPDAMLTQRHHTVH